MSEKTENNIQQTSTQTSPIYLKQSLNEEKEKKYKGIVFDMDGVLRIGNHPIPKANEIIQYLYKNKIQGMISTNECRYSEIELREDLEEIGINIPTTWPIYTSGMALRDYLKKKIEAQPDKNFSLGIIGERGLLETINELTIFLRLLLPRLIPFLN